MIEIRDVIQNNFEEFPKWKYLEGMLRKEESKKIKDLLIKKMYTVKMIETTGGNLNGFELFDKDNIL